MQLLSSSSSSSSSSPKLNPQGSVHRKYILIYIQQDATLHSLFISGNCFSCFGWYLHPSSDKGKGKGKSVPLQAWSGPEGSRKLRFPHFMTTPEEGGRVVSLTHRPHLPPGNPPGTHFC